MAAGQGRDPLAALEGVQGHGMGGGTLCVSPRATLVDPYTPRGRRADAVSDPRARAPQQPFRRHGPRQPGRPKCYDGHDEHASVPAADGVHAAEPGSARPGPSTARSRRAATQSSNARSPNDPEPEELTNAPALPSSTLNLPVTKIIASNPQLSAMGPQIRQMMQVSCSRLFVPWRGGSALQSDMH
jgi:hypothetical protein